jgi:hypothetical protein
MSIEETNENVEFETPGARLNHLLTKIGFKEGRGRVADFHQYLIDTKPNDFADLKYTTVRSWFADHSPVMRKITVIIESLKENYNFNYNQISLKTWWKVGGQYPFKSSVVEVEKTKNNNEKITFYISSLVTEECGPKFEKFSAQELTWLRDIAIKLAIDFADPFKTECPVEYLRLIIRDGIARLSDDTQRDSKSTFYDR